MPLSMDLPLVGYLLSVALDVESRRAALNLMAMTRLHVFQAAGERTIAIVILSSNSILNL